MVKKGIRLACKYSFNCQHANLLDATETLKKVSLGAEMHADDIKEILKKLDTYPFYKAIAKINNIDDPFDIRVISYYWRGTPKLKGNLWHNFTTLLPIKNLPMRHIDPNLIDDCLVHHAVITHSSPDKIIAKYFPVEKENKVLKISERAKSKEVKNIFFGKIKNGEIVTIHFSHIIEKIDVPSAITIDNLTRQSLKKFNDIRADIKV